MAAGLRGGPSTVTSLADRLERLGYATRAAAVADLVTNHGRGAGHPAPGSLPRRARYRATFTRLPQTRGRQ
jgi:hypothetical protein